MHTNIHRRVVTRCVGPTVPVAVASLSGTAVSVDICGSVTAVLCIGNNDRLLCPVGFESPPPFSDQDLYDNIL
jgi:hypothetical protein